MPPAPQLISAIPLMDRYGLDWRIAVTMPESEFEGPLRRDALTNLQISLGAVGVSGTLGMQAVRRVNANLTQGVEGSGALAEGNLDHEVPPGGGDRPASARRGGIASIQRRSAGAGPHRPAHWRCQSQPGGPPAGPPAGNGMAAPSPRTETDCLADDRCRSLQGLQRLFWPPGRRPLPDSDRGGGEAHLQPPWRPAGPRWPAG